MASQDDAQRNGPPLSEWMKIMLDEIERKESEQEEARDELERRGRAGEQDRDAKDDEATDANG